MVDALTTGLKICGTGLVEAVGNVAMGALNAFESAAKWRSPPPELSEQLDTIRSVSQGGRDGPGQAGGRVAGGCGGRRRVAEGGWA